MRRHRLNSPQACVASLSMANVRSGTPSNTAFDRSPECLLLGVLIHMWRTTYVSVCGVPQYVAHALGTFLWSVGCNILRHIFQRG
jgi:hypothetical protein